jgi:hypothetical protein
MIYFDSYAHFNRYSTKEYLIVIWVLEVSILKYFFTEPTMHQGPVKPQKFQSVSGTLHSATEGNW